MDYWKIKKEENYDDDNFKSELQYILDKYDNDTIQNLKTKLIESDKLKTNNDYFKNITNQLKLSNNKDSFGIKNDFEIINFDNFIQLIFNNFILFQWSKLRNSDIQHNIIFYGFNKNPMNELPFWNNYLIIENFINPITLNIKGNLDKLNKSIKIDQIPYLILIDIIKNNEKIENFTKYDIQILLEYSFFLPLFDCKINDCLKYANKKDSIQLKYDKFYKNINILTIEIFLKFIELEFNCFLGELIIYNKFDENNSIPIVIFIFSFDYTEDYVFFFVFQIFNDDFEQFLKQYLTKPENENGDLLKEININKPKSCLKLKFSRHDLIHIDEKSNNTTSKYKILLTDSKIRYMNYGFITYENK